MDATAIRRARKALGVETDSEAVRQNDALIVLTARRHGAMVVTANQRDFELLGGPLRVSIRAV